MYIVRQQIKNIHIYLSKTTPFGKNIILKYKIFVWPISKSTSFRRFNDVMNILQWHLKHITMMSQTYRSDITNIAVTSWTMFSLYTTSLSQVITNHNLSNHLYADDTQVYISISQSNAQESVSTLSDCLTDILLWMESSKLKLNPDKTDLIIICTKQQWNRVINHFPVKLLGSDTFPSDTVRKLGVVFDSNFNFRQHISQVCKSCFYHIRDLRRIWRHIFISTAKTISMALISSRLDYCNSLLNNIAKRDLAKLQWVQNCLACVVLRAPWFSPSLPLLKQLHWNILLN